MGVGTRLVNRAILELPPVQNEAPKFATPSEMGAFAFGVKSFIISTSLKVRIDDDTTRNRDYPNRPVS